MAIYLSHRISISSFTEPRLALRFVCGAGVDNDVTPFPRGRRQIALSQAHLRIDWIWGSQWHLDFRRQTEGGDSSTPV
jgi:hypothetical protein